MNNALQSTKSCVRHSNVHKYAMYMRHFVSDYNNFYFPFYVAGLPVCVFTFTRENTLIWVAQKRGFSKSSLFQGTNITLICERKTSTCQFRISYWQADANFRHRSFFSILILQIRVSDLHIGNQIESLAQLNISGY